MYVYDSHPDIKKKKNLYEDKKINSNKNNYNSYKYNSVYNNKEKTYQQIYLSNSNSFNKIQRINHNFIYNRQLNNKTPHRHHHHLIHFHHHCHTPLSHSHSTSRSCSCSYSPSPIKNISQSIINANYNNEFNNSNKFSNQSISNYNYNNQNNNNKSSKLILFKFDNMTKPNEYINNIYNKQLREHEIDKNNNILYSNSFNNNDNETSFSNAKAFDEYMTKVAINKYNKMKRFNESNYSHKQIEEDLNYTSNNKNSNYNNESFINEYNLIKKNIEEKYKLYNLISNYDDIINLNYKDSNNNNINKINSKFNKNISNENYNEITKDKTIENIKEDLNIDKSYENEKINRRKKENNININKEKTQKIEMNNDNKNNNNKKHNYHYVQQNNSNNNENNIPNSSELIGTDFSLEIKRNENFSIKKDNNNKIDNVIQKAFNERIGPDKNINNFVSFYDNKKIINKDDSHNEKNYGNDNNNDQNKNKENIYDHNLFDYKTKEYEELKKLNISYKQLLDILYNFLNNISLKNEKKNDISNNEFIPSKLFDLSKDLNNPTEFSKKLINLEFSVINNKDKRNNKENDNDNGKDNEKDNLKIDNNFSNYINNKNKTSSLILEITKENSIQLPELNKLAQLNNLVEGMNEKCFSFKDEEIIENIPNDKNKKYIKNDNNKNYFKIDNNFRNISIIDNDKKHLDKKLIDITNNESDRCFACLLGCNVSRRGYSPMRYNPYTKNELRIDDSGYLLDRYNQLKVSFDNENIGKFNIEKNIHHKIPKINNNSKYNSLNNSRDNSKLLKKKIWK